MNFNMVFLLDWSVDLKSVAEAMAGRCTRAAEQYGNPPFMGHSAKIRVEGAVAGAVYGSSASMKSK
jgi:hypothetical protein